MPELGLSTKKPALLSFENYQNLMIARISLSKRRIEELGAAMGMPTISAHNIFTYRF